MSDGSDDFFKQAEREGRFLHSQGVRTTAHVTAESLGERIPPNSPQPERPNHMVRMSHPMEEHHSTDIPVTDIAKSDQRRQPVSLNNQAAQSGKLEHFPQHEAEQGAAKRPQLGSSLESQPAGTPLEAQRKTEQETAKAQLQADRAGTLTASDQAVSQTKAAEKAAEQAKVQQQAPPTQEH